MNREVFIADQRPWLKVDVDVGGPLVWRSDRCDFNFMFNIENTGRTPALNVQIEFKMIFKSDGLRIDDEQGQYADYVLSRGSSGLFTIFPGPEQAQEHPMAYLATTAEMEAAREVMGTPERSSPSITSILIGCVTYQLTLKRTHPEKDFIYETGFIRQVMRLRNGRPSTHIGPDYGDLSPEQLILRGWYGPGRIT